MTARIQQNTLYIMHDTRVQVLADLTRNHAPHDDIARKIKNKTLPFTTISFSKKTAMVEQYYNLYHTLP